MAQSLSIPQQLISATEGLVEFAAQSNSRPSSPTAEAYGEWHRAFHFFNGRLFDNAAPDCLITFTRRIDALGYFCSEAFNNEAGAVAHEIALNPMWFSMLGDRQSFSTLVHEMCHLVRHVSGRPNRKGGQGAPGYHDAVWADLMEAVGLMPTTTGGPGGGRTGFRVGHYVVDDGPFDLACREFLLIGNTINWRDDRLHRAAAAADASGERTDGTADRPASAKNTRSCFVCPGCDLKAWARASAKLACLACDKPLAAR